MESTRIGWAAGCAAALAIAGLSALALRDADGRTTRRNDRLDRMEKPPAGYQGPVFKPSYDFPSQQPAAEERPWEAIDFKTEPERYLQAILAYALEGQDKARWDLHGNTVRRWYHMPWMGPGGQGREFISGLTSERRSKSRELGPLQVKCRQNWAVGFYNPVGGYALGRIWGGVADGTSSKPDLDALPFPAGTVVAKALYTEATPEETPLVTGAPTIQARIVKDPIPGDNSCPEATGGAERVETTMRLLQFDIAVRDPDADPYTGWVFGTFIYDGRLPGADPWTKLKPVGLMWGNDHELSDALASQGQAPAEGIVLSDFGLNRNFGRGGRMNGPVDNPTSACLSCHMTAQYESAGVMYPNAGMPWTIAQCWFRTIKATEAFGDTPSQTVACGSNTSGRRSLDYSLQLAVAAQNIDQALASARGLRRLHDLPEADAGGVRPSRE